MINFFFRFIDAFLPPDHDLIKDHASRRKLRLVMGVGAIASILFLLRFPILYRQTPDLALQTAALGLFYLSCNLYLILRKGKHYLLIAAVMLATGIFQALYSSYSVGMYPALNLPFMSVIVIAGHYLFGRWTSLFILVLMMVVFYPLAFSGWTPGHPENTYNVAPQFWQLRHFTNVFFATLILWLIAEAYDRFRDDTEVELKRIRAAQDQDLELARSIQQDLLPVDDGTGPYRFSGYMETPSRVGGDYFDRIRTVRYQWFAIGDAAGHGLQAGMIVMQVRSLLHYCISAEKLDEPGKIVNRINEALYDSLRILFHRSFMTFLLLRLDERGYVQYAGSHLSILLYRRSSGKIETYSTHGKWLGVHKESASRAQIIDMGFQIESGDTMLLYTDGVTEAENLASDQFGLDRLIEAMRTAVEKSDYLSEINASIRDSVRKFQGGVRPSDDLTLLTLRRQ